MVAHIMASRKRGVAFDALQDDLNKGDAARKRWRMVLDGGIRWNSSYSMIKRALELRPALNAYSVILRGSDLALDREIFNEDFLSNAE